MFANFHIVNSPIMAAFKLLVLLVESKEVCTLSSPDSLWWLQYTPLSAGGQPRSLGSQEMMERVCVVRDGQGSFLISSLIYRLSYGKVILPVYPCCLLNYARHCSSPGSLVADNIDEVSALPKRSF